MRTLASLLRGTRSGFWALLCGCPAASPAETAPPASTPRSVLELSTTAPPAAQAPTAASPSEAGDAAAPSPASLASAASPSPPCPDDMVDVGRACIDEYEAPNERGVAPLTMVTADEAVAWCEQQGKRLCTEDEWLRACQGPNGLTYPYGNVYEEHHCNHDTKYRVPKWGVLARWPDRAAKAEVQRLDQSEPSGHRATCGSHEGVFDLTGNVAEWVVKLHDHPEACKDDSQRSHTYVTQGCSWVKCYRKPHEPACDYVNCAHPSGFRSYDTGFRCCQDRLQAVAQP